jgi:uncharacterized protein (DUF2062 family)
LTWRQLLKLLLLLLLLLLGSQLHCLKPRHQTRHVSSMLRLLRHELLLLVCVAAAAAIAPGAAAAFFPTGVQLKTVKVFLTLLLLLLTLSTRCIC